MQDEQKILPLPPPPSYDDASHIIQMPPPPYSKDGPPPLSLMEAHYGEAFQGPAPRRQQEEQGGLVSSWKAVLREGRWTFFGCCSCILLILLIVVIVISVAPGLRKIHH
ncbi:hypothetical protein BJV82DRAFT_671060 [Fennellomyces sp. T-0311]|nr:hypothetical protein BJV82DRAFT_671060 [Fennellomyces sp. T-0311]